MVKTTPTFRYSINTDYFYGTTRVNRLIDVIVENSPRTEDNCFEQLSIEDVKTMRDMLNQIIKRVENDTSKQETAGE